jgi:hypothetical protein
MCLKGQARSALGMCAAHTAPATGADVLGPTIRLGAWRLGFRPGRLCFGWDRGLVVLLAGLFAAVVIQLVTVQPLGMGKLWPKGVAMLGLVIGASDGVAAAQIPRF